MCFYIAGNFLLEIPGGLKYHNDSYTDYKVSNALHH